MGAFGLLAEYGIKALGEKAPEVLGRRAAATMAKKYVAGEAGQAAITKVAGAGVAKMAKSPLGQYAVGSETKKVMGKGAADHSGDAKPKPAAQDTSNYASNSRSEFGLPGANYGARSQADPYAVQGRGTGWWNLQNNANDDWRQMENRGVHRGPAKWDLPGQRSVAFAKGITGAAVGNYRAAKSDAWGAINADAAAGAERSSWAAPTIHAAPLQPPQDLPGPMHGPVQPAQLALNPSTQRGVGPATAIPQPAVPKARRMGPGRTDQFNVGTQVGMNGKPIIDV